MDLLFPLLSLLPILILLTISLWKGVNAGIYSGLVVTIILFFIWDSNVNAFPAAFIAAFIDTVSILMIVFGALFLHQNMEHGGFIDQIKESLQGVHKDAGFQFYFLAFFLTMFFESVAGFGTPGAIIPLLLISMGYSAVMSISVVLLMNGLSAVAGAIGTPVKAGFIGPLDLTTEQISKIYLYSSAFMVIGGCIVVVFIHRFVTAERSEAGNYNWKVFFSLSIPYLGLSYFLGELTGVVAAAVMGSIAYFFLFTNRNINWRPWIPYGVLLVILILPKIIQPLGSILSWEWKMNNIFNSTVEASLKPLSSPLIPFILTSFLALKMGSNRSIYLKPVVRKTISVFLILFPSLAITRLMMSSGNEMASMVEYISVLFAQTGPAYPMLSPFVGVVGAFITGSTTVSNVIFGPVQFNAAQNLSLNTEFVLSMQHIGAGLGNAICLFNIIAAAAVAGVQNYGAILRKNMLPVTLSAGLIGLIGFVVLSVI